MYEIPSSFAPKCSLNIRWFRGDATNAHMAPHLDDLSERKSISNKCAFGNNLHLQATANGVIKLRVQEKSKAVEVRMNDVLWVPELACRLLSTGSIRRHGGEFVDSEIRRNHIALGKGGPKIDLDEKNGFVTLRGSVKRNNRDGVVHAALAGKRPRLSLRDWRNVLCHIQPGAIKHLEKRG